MSGDTNTEDKLIKFLSEEVEVDRLLTAGIFIVLCEAAEQDPNDVLTKARSFLADLLSKGDVSE